MHVRILSSLEDSSLALRAYSSLDVLVVRVRTEFFELDIPETFEKVTQMGQLTRAERMDRGPDEDCFAELNLYVGRFDEEKFELSPGASADSIARALWERHCAREQQVTPECPIRVLHEDEGPGQRSGIIELPANRYRPLSRQWIRMTGYAASDPPCFGSFVLEYDARRYETYEAWAAWILDHVRWKAEPFRVEHFERQAKAVWSVFDDMEPRRREAIRNRYLEIVRVPAAERPPDVEVKLDLRPPEPADRVAAVQDLGAGPVTLWVRVPVFSEELEVRLPGLEAAPHVDRSALLGCLAGLGSEDATEAARLLWAHGQMCFEATDYGAPEGVKNEDDFDLRSPEDALARCGAGRIDLSEDPDDGCAELFGISFYPPWEQEHGCLLVLRKGRFVGWTENGGSLTDVEDGRRTRVGSKGS